MASSVREWLAGLELEHLTTVFEKAQVGLRDLSLLDEDDLRELGLALGPRRRVLNAIAAMKSTDGVDSGGKASNDHADSGVERRQLTVMFCDLVGSTELSHRLDPEDLREIMRSYQDTVTRSVARYGGHVAKYLGDGLLVYFGWPQAFENQAERAVRAGLDAVAAVAQIELGDREMLQARVGIASGQVVIGDLVGEAGREAEAVTGDTPNMAARLQQLAPPGQVVINQITRELIGPFFEVAELGTYDLKGFSRPVPAWKVACMSTAEARFAAGDRSLTRFIGREHELGLLLDRWEQTKSGDGQVVLLSGEAGIGKSRLLNALCERLNQASCMTLRYQCSPYHVDDALHPVVQHYVRAARITPSDDDTARVAKLEAFLAASRLDLSSAAPLLAHLMSLPLPARYAAPTLSPEKRKERTLDLILDHLAALARHAPVLMLVEDAHWIDPTTQELLEATALMIVDHPVLLVIAHRPEWQTSFSGAPNVTPLMLNRLARARTYELVRAAGGDGLSAAVVDEIVARTDGIPLFVEELTKTVIEAGDVEAEVPKTLQASLLARLDRLGPAKHVIQVGAVIGREFDHTLLASLIDTPEPNLDRLIEHLIASELVYRQGRPPNVTYVFKHALIQQAAYESLLKSRRRVLHGDIAQALLREEPERTPLLAYHWERAENIERALECRMKAAEQSSALYAIREANAEYWSALALLDRMPPSQGGERRRIDILLRMITWGTYFFWRGETERAMARRHLDRATEAARSLQDWAGLARLQAYIGNRWDDEALLMAATAEAARSGDIATEAAVAESCAAYFGRHGLFGRALGYVEHALRLFEELDEKLSQGRLLTSGGRCYYARAGRLDEAFRCARQAKQIAGIVNDLRLSAWMPMEAEVFFYKGLWKEVVDVVESGIAPAWTTGTWDVILWTHAWAAIAYLKLDRRDDAARLIDRAMSEVIPRVGSDFPKIYPLIALGQLQLATGDASSAVETGRHALALAERSANRLELGAVHRALAQAYEQVGDDTEAGQTLGYVHIRVKHLCASGQALPRARRRAGQREHIHREDRAERGRLEEAQHLNLPALAFRSED
jgi:class 3 adenylate cyclase/tetratricopeptide (TPR) repeat protein